MFGGGSTNPYDDIVVKTTDENLTTENWELILNLCDKVSDEGQEGAHNVTAALLKRLAHRNSNVQLYTLSLAESLSKNCGIEFHRELASRAFTSGLEKLVTDRNTHQKVRTRTLALIAEWAELFDSDPTLGIMEDCLKSLESKGHRPPPPVSEPLPPAVDDERRRQEEEELQRVLEISVQDKGGRGTWETLYGSSSAAGSSAAAASSSSAASGSASGSSGVKYTGGYVPARTPSPAVVSTPIQTFSSPQHNLPQSQPPPPTSTDLSPSSPIASTAIVTRVRALHPFTPTEPGELAFQKDDIIKVVDRNYKDWWRGQLKGRTGIFPVNYVEPLPEPTEEDLAREAMEEAKVFSEAVNVERLLQMLRSLEQGDEGSGAGLAENEEIQELYRQCMALRPKIVKLIDKYSQKRADLVSMNESFVRARSIFDRMMEESLSRHTSIYGQPPYASEYRPDSRAPYPGWQAPGPANGVTPGTALFPTPSPAQGYGYPQAAQQAQQGATGYGYGPQGQGVGPQPYPGPQQAQQAQSQPQPYPGQQQQVPQAHSQATLPAQAPAQTYPGPQQAQQTQQQPYPGPQQAQQAQPQTQPQTQPYPGPQQAQQVPPQTQAQPYPGLQQAQQVPPQAQTQAQPYSGPQQAQQVPPQAQTQAEPYPGPQQVQQPQAAAQQSHPVQQQQPSYAQQSQPQPQSQSPQPQHQQYTAQQSQAQPQSQAGSTSQPSTTHGPPYLYDPTATYADPNVQAWAQYYAHGGKDKTGAVYFVSVPGVTDDASLPVATNVPTQQTQSKREAQTQPIAQALVQGAQGQSQPLRRDSQGTTGPGSPRRSDSFITPNPYPEEPEIQDRPVSSYHPTTTNSMMNIGNSSTSSLPGSSSIGGLGGAGGGGGVGGGIGGVGGPVAAPRGGGTPSWVLPKHDVQSGMRGGRSTSFSSPDGNPNQNPQNGLVGQMGGMNLGSSVSEPGHSVLL